MPPKKNKKKAKAPSPTPDLSDAPVAAAPAPKVEAEQPVAEKVMTRSAAAVPPAAPEAAAEKPAETKEKPAAPKKKKKPPPADFLGDDDDDPSPAAATAAAAAAAAAAVTAAAGDAAAAEAAPAAKPSKTGAPPASDEALRLSIQSMSAETVELKLTVEPGAAAVVKAEAAATDADPAADRAAGRAEAEEDAAAEKALASKKQKRKQREAADAAAAAAGADADAAAAGLVAAAAADAEDAPPPSPFSGMVGQCLGVGRAAGLVSVPGVATQGAMVPTPAWDAELAFAEGWLDKESRNLKQWRKRWVVVLGARKSGAGDEELPALLATFKAPRSSWGPGAPPPPTEAVRLSGATVEATEGRPHTLRLCVQGETEDMLLTAEGAVEFSTWTGALRGAIGAPAIDAAGPSSPGGAVAIAELHARLAEAAATAAAGGQSCAVM